MVGIALLAGASFENGVLGVAGLIAIAALISAAFASLSARFALIAQGGDADRHADVPGCAVLHLVDADRARPDARLDAVRGQLQPGQWAVEAGEQRRAGDGGFDVVATRAGLLTGFVALSAWLGCGRWRSYRSL